MASDSSEKVCCLISFCISGNKIQEVRPLRKSAGSCGQQKTGTYLPHCHGIFCAVRVLRGRGMQVWCAWNRWNRTGDPCEECVWIYRSVICILTGVCLKICRWESDRWYSMEFRGACTRASLKKSFHTDFCTRSGQIYAAECEKIYEAGFVPHSVIIRKSRNQLQCFQRSSGILCRTRLSVRRNTSDSRLLDIRSACQKQSVKGVRNIR